VSRVTYHLRAHVEERLSMWTRFAMRAKGSGPGAMVLGLLAASLACHGRRMLHNDKMDTENRRSADRHGGL